MPLVMLATYFFILGKPGKILPPSTKNTAITASSTIQARRRERVRYYDLFCTSGSIYSRCNTLLLSLSLPLSLSLSLPPPPSQVIDPPRDSNGDPAIDDSKPLLGDDDREAEEEGGGGDIQLNARGFKIKLQFFNKEELGMSLTEGRGEREKEKKREWMRERDSEREREFTNINFDIVFTFSSLLVGTCQVHP